MGMEGNGRGYFMPSSSGCHIRCKKSRMAPSRRHALLAVTAALTIDFLRNIFEVGCIEKINLAIFGGR